MHTSRRLWRAVPLAFAGLALAATSAGAFEPTVTLTTADEGQRYVATDLAARRGAVAVTVDGSLGDERWVTVHWTQDGIDWDHNDAEGLLARESQATICDDHVVVAHARSDVAPASGWSIRIARYSLDSSISGGAVIAGNGTNRKPDVACIANQKIAVAFFKQTDSGHRVRLVVRNAAGEELSPQSFNVAPASMAKGLAVAATAQRVYLAWFDGNALKLRRYSVGAAPDFALTSLGTSTILTHRSARDPRLGADGTRVVIAYQRQGDLRLRRSTNRGVSFGGATTLRNNPYPSEIGTSATTVHVVGKRIAVGAIELAGVETLTGKGIGWFSVNFGASWQTRPKHVGGRTVAGLIEVDGVRKYAEAWDQSVAQPADASVRFRHD